MNERTNKLIEMELINHVEDKTSFQLLAAALAIETEELMEYIKDGRDDRIYAVAELIRRNVDLGLIYNTTKIDMFFLEKIKHIIKINIVYLL
jgi:hypothetical protein